MKLGTFHIISLGCAKNLVDSRSMTALLLKEGLQEKQAAGQADFIIVNTCGFIAPARAESIHELKKVVRKKKMGQFIIAAGCLSQYQGALIMQQVPGIDAMLGTREWMKVPAVVRELIAKNAQQDTPSKSPSEIDPFTGDVIRAAEQGRSAYLKIADGCRRSCAFCSIPLIKGAAVSRPIAEIIRDAITLQQRGMQEINLIAQDTTDYGTDLGMKDGLPKLLEEMIPAIPAVPWIRLLYAFPGCVTDRLIGLMASQEQILHYLDIPLQHAHPDILRSMDRPSNVEWVRRTIEKMRKAMPDLSIRSTFIVGFPGESERHFATLLDFIKEIGFDRLGVFPYSFEPGTPAEDLGDPISEKEKLARVEQLMLTQQEISLGKNKTFVGRSLKILVEGIQEEFVIGRSYRDAPEIDGLVFARGQAQLGDLVPVRITGALVHDLSGTIIDEKAQ